MVSFVTWGRPRLDDLQSGLVGVPVLVGVQGLAGCVGGVCGLVVRFGIVG